MPTKKKKKASGVRLQASGRNVRPEARSRKPEARSDTVIARLEEQIASLEEQIAGLQTSEDRLRASDFRLQEEVSKTNPEAGSPKPEACPSLKSEARAQLATPVITAVTSVGSHFLRVTWTSVANADGYLIQRSTGSAFSNNVQSWTVASSVTSTIISELGTNTLYYVRVRAVASGTNTDSEFSSYKSARTGLTENDENATHLQSWLNEQQTLFQNFSTLLPQLESTVLTTADHRRLRGSGVRRYGFADKVSDVSAEFPQFWPASVSGAGGNPDFQDKLKERLREIEVLRNLLVWSRYVNRVVGDLLLIAGDDAFHMANTYYSTVRAAARSHLPEAGQVFEMLRLFWKRPRRTSEEPTLPEIERDFRGVLHGTKDGIVSAQHESPHVSGGVHEVIDNVHSAKCRVKETAKQSRHE